MCSTLRFQALNAMRKDVDIVRRVRVGVSSALILPRVFLQHKRGFHVHMTVCLLLPNSDDSSSICFCTASNDRLRVPCTNSKTRLKIRSPATSQSLWRTSSRQFQRHRHKYDLLCIRVFNHPYTPRPTRRELNPIAKIAYSSSYSYG
jgi:hypothetical protein